LAAVEDPRKLHDTNQTLKNPAHVAGPAFLMLHRTLSDPKVADHKG
jgi:hypothetical protein